MEKITTVKQLISALQKVEDQKASVFILEMDFFNTEHKILSIDGVTTIDGETYVRIKVR